MKKVNVLLPTVVITALIILCGFYIFNLLYYDKIHSADLIAKDISQLVTIFQKIDNDCGIISFDYQKNPINFLNVKEFVGSEVGPLNLAHPEKWEGPYLPDNLTMQAKEYQIVKAKDGYYITPGPGVQLANGRIIDQDLILDEDADIAAMMEDDEGFRYKGKVFAAPLLGPAGPVPAPRLADVAGKEGA